MPVHFHRTLVAVVLVAAAPFAIAGTPQSPIAPPADVAAAADASVEEICVLRSLRESSSAPDAFCGPEKVGFAAVNHSHF